MTNPPDPKTKTPRSNAMFERLLDFRGSDLAGEFYAEVSALELENQSLTRRLEEAEKPAINTSLRLFDLVRYSRAELHQDGLITDEEYAWLCGGPMAVSPKGGSPSRQRLEDYDELRAKLTALRTAAEAARDALEGCLKDTAFVHARNPQFEEPAHRYADGHKALAALRAELDQPASNASNSPTASRDK